MFYSLALPTHRCISAAIVIGGVFFYSYGSKGTDHHHVVHKPVPSSSHAVTPARPNANSTKAVFM